MGRGTGRDGASGLRKHVRLGFRGTRRAGHRAAKPSRCRRSGGGDAPPCHHPSSLRPSGCGRLFLHVPAWGRLDLGVLVVARRLRRGYLLAAGLGEPFVPGRPPAAGYALCGVQPLVGVGVVRSAVRADPVVALLLRRRIDHTGDVAAGAKYECRFPTKQLGAGIGRLPRNDVVGARGVQERRDVDGAEVDGTPLCTVAPGSRYLFSR